MSEAGRVVRIHDIRFLPSWGGTWKYIAVCSDRSLLQLKMNL
jgi:hypothetical protein